MSNTREELDPANPPATTTPTSVPARSADARRSPLVFKIISVVAALALVGFIVGVVVTRSGPTPRTTFPATHPHALAVGTRAPSFNLGRLGGGRPVTLATGDGHPVILNFFASWCSNCQRELSAVAAAARSGQDRVVVIGIDTSDTSTAAPQRLLSAAGATFAVGVDPNGTVATRYAITGLPVTFYVAADGRIAGVGFGAQSQATLLRWERRLAPER